MPIERVFNVHGPYRVFDISAGEDHDESHGITHPEGNDEDIRYNSRYKVINEGKMVVLSECGPVDFQVIVFAELRNIQPETIVFKNEFAFIPCFMFEVHSVLSLTLQDVIFNFGNNSSFLDTVIWCFPSLIELDVSHPHVEGMFALHFVVKHYIKHLFIRDSQEVSNEMLTDISISFPVLEEFALLKSSVKNGAHLMEGIESLLYTSPGKVYLDLDSLCLEDAMLIADMVKEERTSSTIYLKEECLITKNGVVLSAHGRDRIETVKSLLNLEEDHWDIDGSYDSDGNIFEKETACFSVARQNSLKE